MAETTEPRNRRRSDFRIIRGEGGNYKVHYYGTKEKRDFAAQIFADRDGTNVATELWDAEHDQSILNEGWGCDGHREPRARSCTCARNNDGSVTTMLCSIHATTDPCETFRAVTGKRRTGSILGGVCTACGWRSPATPMRGDT